MQASSQEPLPLAGLNSNKKKVMENRYDEFGEPLANSRLGSRDYIRMYAGGGTAGMLTGSGLDGISHGLGSSSM